MLGTTVVRVSRCRNGRLSKTDRLACEVISLLENPNLPADRMTVLADLMQTLPEQDLMKILARETICGCIRVPRSTRIKASGYSPRELVESDDDRTIPPRDLPSCQDTVSAWELELLLVRNASGHGARVHSKT